MYKPISHILHTFLLLVLIGTSTSIVYILKTTPNGSPVVSLTATPPSNTLPAATQRIEIPTPVPTQTAPPEPIAEAGWDLIRPGFERRVIQVYDAQQQPVESVHIWRLDQKYFRLDVDFDARPKTLENWQKETNAALVVNGGYFSINSERYSADGLLVVNGAASGRTFTGYGGMLAITGSNAELRWLVEKPYDPGESLQAALQAFPILVEPGGRLGFGAERENYARARRTVIAQDRKGRILFIVTPQGYFTLHELSAYLTDSGLDLDIALNLDGGGSTGLMVAEPREVIPARVLLPFVILVYAR